MGRRAPVIIVDSIAKVEDIKAFCSTTVGHGDGECQYVGYKMHGGKFYVCIDTYTLGLEEVLAVRYSGEIIARVAQIEGRCRSGLKISDAYHPIKECFKCDWAALEMVDGQ